MKILYPSLGCPLLLKKEEVIDIELIALATEQEVKTLGDKVIITLQPSNDKSPQQAQKAQVEAQIELLPNKPIKGLKSKFWVINHGPNQLSFYIDPKEYQLFFDQGKELYKISGKLDTKVLGTFSRALFDLEFPEGILDKPMNSSEKQVPIYHCVFIAEKFSGNFAHLTDIHLADRNDEIQQRINAAFRSQYVNFNDNFRQFIKEVNEKKEEIDFILLTGDIVDFVLNNTLYPPDQRPPFDESNWKIFRSIILGKENGKEKGQNISLEVPVFTVIGNHDTRLCPYFLGSLASANEYNLPAGGIGLKPQSLLDILKSSFSLLTTELYLAPYVEKINPLLRYSFTPPGEKERKSQDSFIGLSSGGIDTPFFPYWDVICQSLCKIFGRGAVPLGVFFLVVGLVFLALLPWWLLPKLLEDSNPILQWISRPTLCWISTLILLALPVPFIFLKIREGKRRSPNSTGFSTADLSFLERLVVSQPKTEKQFFVALHSPLLTSIPKIVEVEKWYQTIRKIALWLEDGVFWVISLKFVAAFVHWFLRVATLGKKDIWYGARWPIFRRTCGSVVHKRKQFLDACYELSSHGKMPVKLLSGHMHADSEVKFYYQKWLLGREYKFAENKEDAERFQKEYGVPVLSQLQYKAGGSVGFETIEREELLRKEAIDLMETVKPDKVPIIPGYHIFRQDGEVVAHNLVEKEKFASPLMLEPSSAGWFRFVLFCFIFIFVFLGWSGAQVIRMQNQAEFSSRFALVKGMASQGAPSLLKLYEQYQPYLTVDQEYGIVESLIRFEALSQAEALVQVLSRRPSQGSFYLCQNACLKENLADIYDRKKLASKAQKNYKEAIQMFEKSCLDKNEEPVSRFYAKKHQGDCASKLEYWADARSYYEEALDLAGVDWEKLKNVAITYEIIKNIKDENFNQFTQRPACRKVGLGKAKKISEMDSEIFRSAYMLAYTFANLSKKDEDSVHANMDAMLASLELLRCPQFAELRQEYIKSKCFECFLEASQKVQELENKHPGFFEKFLQVKDDAVKPHEQKSF